MAGFKSHHPILLSGLYYTDIAANVNNNYQAVQACLMFICFKNLSKMESKDFVFIDCHIIMLITNV